MASEIIRKAPTRGSTIEMDIDSEEDDGAREEEQSDSGSDLPNSTHDTHALVDMMDLFRPDAVVHLASWGMSGAPLLSPKCKAVNIGGVEAVL